MRLRILLVIGAIAALAAGCYLLIRNWEAIKTAVMNTEAFAAAAAVVKWLAGIFASAWQYISDGWNAFTALLAGFSPAQALKGMATGIMTMFDNVWQTIKDSFLKSWNWIVEKLNKIPGVNIGLAGTAAQDAKQLAAPMAPDNPQSLLTANTLSTGGELKGIEKGGLSKTINSNSKSVVDNSKKIENVNIYPKEMLTPGQLMEYQELGA